MCPNLISSIRRSFNTVGISEWGRGFYSDCCVFYLTDQDLVVVLVCKLAQSISHVGDPVFQVVHPILTTNAEQQRHKRRWELDGEPITKKKKKNIQDVLLRLTCS